MLSQFDIVRHIMCRIGQGLPNKHNLAKALRKWAKEHKDWLAVAHDGQIEGLLHTLGAAQREEEVPLPILLSEGVSDRLAFDEQERELLRIVVARARLSFVNSLFEALNEGGVSSVRVIGLLVGWEGNQVMRRMRRSKPARLGLVYLSSDNRGQHFITTGDPLDKLLDKASGIDEPLIDIMVGARQPCPLGSSDFTHVEAFDHLVALLRGATREGAEGINILIHGPAGTGKTELARVIATTAGLALHAVGEIDGWGEEPMRYERLQALQLAQSLLASGHPAAILFDEMEDLIGDTKPTQGGWMTSRPGSKIFVNRLLENNKVPVIWTTNTIGNVEPALLRRMAHVLRLGPPPPSAAGRILQRIEEDEKTGPLPSLAALAQQEAGATTVLRVAARAARLTGDPQGAEIAATSLLSAISGDGQVNRAAAPFDPSLINADPSLNDIERRLSSGNGQDATLLLSGRSGTGKTALARYLARTMDRQVMTARAGDILGSCDPLGTVAKLFLAARMNEAIILIDEAEGLLTDRRELTGAMDLRLVNDVLERMDDHPLPIFAATHAPERIDPAARRRFVYRMTLGPVRRQSMDPAARHFFARPAPDGLSDLEGLVLGDFAVVAKRLRHSDPMGDQALLDELKLELQAVEETRPFGFSC